MNTPHDIIGYKQSIFGISDKGNVVPIAKLENGQIEEISLHDYPNTNTIFISRNYEEIDQKVIGQLGKINNIKQQLKRHNKNIKDTIDKFNKNK